MAKLQSDHAQEPLDADDVSPQTVKRWAFLALLLALPVYVGVDHLAGGGKARAAAIAFALLVGVIRAHWYLRERLWYWLTLAGLVALQVILVVLVPWSDRVLPAPLLWPIGIADFLAMFGAIALAERVARTRGTVRG